MRFVIATAFTMLTTFPAAGASAPCAATSGERRVPLLELYTSEGCDSCPPADRWVSGLAQRGYGSDRVTILSYQVDLGVGAFVHDVRSGDALQALTVAVCRG